MFADVTFYGDYDGKSYRQGATTRIYIETQVTGAPANVPDTFEAFNQPADPPVKLCRPCNERGEVGEGVYGSEKHKSLIHACDGNGCQCPTCDILATVREMNQNWDIIERSETWPSD